MAYTHITPGWEIEMSAHYYSDKNADRVAELIQLPREELAAMEEASVAKEKTIFSKCSEIETEWKKQAAETAALRKAREYLRALPVEHTSNQWKVNQFGWHVLSNMVYKMSYRVSEHKKPDGTLINCALSWDIIIIRSSILLPTTPAPAGRSLGRATKCLPLRRKWSDTCKAGSKPTPTCSRKFPHLSHRIKRAGFASTVFCSQATPWRSRSARPKRWRMTFSPFWRTGTCRSSRRATPLHRRLKKRDRLLKRRLLPHMSAAAPKKIQKPHIKRNRSP